MVVQVRSIIVWVVVLHCSLDCAVVALVVVYKG